MDGAPAGVQMQMQGQMPVQQLMGQGQPMGNGGGMGMGMGMMQPGIGGQGGYGFAARPQVVKPKKKYRDPYREFVKVAPQNLMYDRRVVRGNTFAALVIPVNMQPDPALIEKQKIDEAYMKQRQEEMRMRRHQEKMRHQQQQQEQQNIQMAQMQSSNLWEALEDEENFANESDIESDYYVDRPPTAIFIEDQAGEDKKIQVMDWDPELFDFNNEVEPILQVLVGKSIEHARIEVIEEHEAQQLAKHKRRFLQLKEAELMETQRLEEARARKSDEVDRRNLQMRTAKNQLIAAEKKVVARLYAKNFLNTFKKNTMNTLIDLGTLRRPLDLSTGAAYVPQMYNQVQFDMQSFHDHQDQLDDVLQDSMAKISLVHKQSIIKELNRRQEKKKEEMKRKRMEEEAKKQRKQKRANLREQKRLTELKDKVQREIIVAQDNQDFTPKTKVYDIRDPLASNDGIIIIGGFVGEMIMTWTCLLDFIFASPANQNFVFSQDMFEKYLHELLASDESQFSDECIVLYLNRSPEELAGDPPNPDRLWKAAKDNRNMADFGLKFLFDCQKDLVLNAEAVETIYKGLIGIACMKPAELIPPPEITSDMDEDKKEEVNDQIEKTKNDNEQIEKDNANIEKIKKKVVIRQQTVPYPDDKEQVLIKLNNHRPEIDAGLAPPEGIETNLDDTFNPEKLPTKIPLVKTTDATGSLQTLVYHAEGVYSLRRVLIEQAKKSIKELEKCDMNQILIHSAQRTKMLDERFEEMMIRNQGYGRGCQYSDPNMRITYRTFLHDAVQE